MLPYLHAAGELKTKPTQHSVGKLREIGIQADVLVCRSEVPVDKALLKKIAMFCNVPFDAVFTSPDVDTIYQLPLVLCEQGLDDKLSQLLNIWSRAARLTAVGGAGPPHPQPVAPRHASPSSASTCSWSSRTRASTRR